jgi:hypothetical protein
MAGEVHWRRTKLTRDLIRCDLCGEKADTIHFVTDGDYPGSDGRDDQVEVVFGCPKHDAGGYHIELKRWFNPEEGVREHIDQKTRGQAGVAAADRRFDRLLGRRLKATAGRTSRRDLAGCTDD